MVKATSECSSVLQLQWPTHACRRLRVRICASLRASLNNFHRSKTGIITPRARLVISDPCMMFDLVPETSSLALHDQLNWISAKWWSSPEWHNFLKPGFFFWIHLRCWKRTSLWTEFSMPSVRELVLSFVHGEVFNWRRNMPFSIMQSVCQWMMLLPSLWNHFVFVSKIVGTPDRFSESTPMLLPRNPKTSSVLTSLIVPFGHKPSDLATRNLDQLPEPLGRMDLHVASSMPDGRRGFRVAQSAFRTLRRRCTLRRKIVAEEHVVLVFWCGVHTIFLW